MHEFLTSRAICDVYFKLTTAQTHPFLLFIKGNKKERKTVIISSNSSRRGFTGSSGSSPGFLNSQRNECAGADGRRGPGGPAAAGAGENLTSRWLQIASLQTHQNGLSSVLCPGVQAAGLGGVPRRPGAGL